MRRIALALLGALVLLLAGSQLLLPPLLEGRIADRLTQRGGRASVELEAIPAAGLLFDRGRRIAIAASDVELEIDQDDRVLERLDGFDTVDVELRRLRAGPFRTDRFLLSRSAKDDPYHLEMRATASGDDVADFAADELPGTLGRLGARLAGEALQEVARAVPVELDLELASDGGEPRVVSGEGTIAGLRADPLAEAIAAAVVSQL